MHTPIHFILFSIEWYKIAAFLFSFAPAATTGQSPTFPPQYQQKSYDHFVSSQLRHRREQKNVQCFFFLQRFNVFRYTQNHNIHIVTDEIVIFCQTKQSICPRNECTQSRNKKLNKNTNDLKAYWIWSVIFFFLSLHILFSLFAFNYFQAIRLLGLFGLLCFEQKKGKRQQIKYCANCKCIFIK